MKIELPRYAAEIYCGRVRVGMGNFNTVEDCMQFAINDSFADKLIIYDIETNKKQIIKTNPKEV